MVYIAVQEKDSTVKPVYKGHSREHENDAFVHFLGKGPDSS